MKKTYIIILCVQFAMLLVLLIFAFIQKAEADLQRQAAQANAIQAQRNATEAMMQHLLAREEKNRADSLQQQLDNLLQTPRK